MMGKRLTCGSTAPAPALPDCASILLPRKCALALCHHYHHLVVVAVVLSSQVFDGKTKHMRCSGDNTKRDAPYEIRRRGGCTLPSRQITCGQKAHSVSIKCPSSRLGPAADHQAHELLSEQAQALASSAVPKRAQSMLMSLCCVHAQVQHQQQLSDAHMHQL